MKRLLLSIFCLFVFSLYAQKKVKYNSEMSYPDNSGCYYAKVHKTDTCYRLDFYNCSKRILCSREYALNFKPKTMNAQYRAHGTSKYYDFKGNIIRITHFNNGLRIGNETEYFANGNLRISRLFRTDGMPSKKEIEYYNTGSVKRIREYDSEKLYAYIERFFSLNGQQIAELNYQNNKILEGYKLDSFKNGYSAKKVYKNSELEFIIGFTPDGDTNTIYTYKSSYYGQRLDNVLSYANGVYYKKTNFHYDVLKSPNSIHVIDSSRLNKIDSSKIDTSNLIKHLNFIDDHEDGFANFISNNLKYPNQAKIDGKSGKVQVSAIIGREGNILEISASKLGDEYLDSETQELFNVESLRVFELTDGMWIPARASFGNLTISYIKTPVTFEIYDENW